jgi:aerobic-type carbon monoxide dehydrogenase small subunit (CoxS/CutS family)
MMSSPSARAGAAPTAGRRIELRVNGSAQFIAVEPRRALLDALRDDLGLTGAKKGCGMGNCGACTVLLEGRAVYACLLFAVDCDGREVTTIEGLGADGQLHPVQQAFIDADAFQCGFCTSGQIMSRYALVRSNTAPTEEAVREAVENARNSVALLIQRDEARIFVPVQLG